MPAKRKALQDEVAEVMSTGSREPVGLRPVTAEDLAADRAYIDALGGEATDTPDATAAEEPERVDGAAADAPSTEAADTKPIRGGVNALVSRLLADPELSYEAIVAQVVASFPGASTTARSVASTASVLRRKGTAVPMRRSPRPL